MRRVYTVEKTPCAFFTAVFIAYKDENAYITSEDSFQAELGDEFIPVSPDNEKAARVVKKLKTLDKKCLYEIDYLLKTPYPDREQTAFSYLKLIVQSGGPAREMLADEGVQKAMLYIQRVSYERERMSGFLRFQETQNGVYYAACSPDNDLIELLMPHFCARFKTVPFVIHDKKRNLAGVYDGTSWLVVPAGEAQVVLSEREEGFLRLWSKYYSTVAIPERKNTRQMKGYMPVRYWSFMPEKIAEENERIL